MKYLLLLKRLLKRKSYILMLVLVPLLVNVLILLGDGSGAVMKIGVYVPGQDASSQALREMIYEDSAPIRYVKYYNLNEMIADLKDKTIDEGWAVPYDLDTVVRQMAASQYPSDKIYVLIREEGLSHMLGREIITSKVYPLIAKQLMIQYMSKNIYDGKPTEKQLLEMNNSYEAYNVDGSFFEMGYFDEATNKISYGDSILLMPLRGIISIWLLLCGIATSMYYLIDEKNGLFIWWKTKTPFLRDIGYYGVVFILPTIIAFLTIVQCNGIALQLSDWATEGKLESHREYMNAVLATVPYEALTLIVYVFNIIFLAMLFRMIFRSVRNLGILTPALIMMTMVLSPVFIDIKELRPIQRFCPAFHYLSSLHDHYYLVTLGVYTVILGGVILVIKACKHFYNR